jgi:hypothetical protein
MSFYECSSEIFEATVKFIDELNTWSIQESMNHGWNISE